MMLDKSTAWGYQSIRAEGPAADHSVPVSGGQTAARSLHSPQAVREDEEQTSEGEGEAQGWGKDDSSSLILACLCPKVSYFLWKLRMI